MGQIGAAGEEAAGEGDVVTGGRMASECPVLELGGEGIRGRRRAVVGAASGGGGWPACVPAGARAVADTVRWLNRCRPLVLNP